MNSNFKLMGAIDPLVFCFCGPTASGKTTLSRTLCYQEPQTLKLSVSTTTRGPREGEVEGEHYYYVAEEEFNQRVENADFLEHANFGGNWYGTERRNIQIAEAENKDLVIDLDVQGVEQLKMTYPDRLVTIFVFPPSFAELKNRLIGRGTEDQKVQEERLWIATHEVAKLREPGFSDYLLINSNFDDCLASAKDIISAERQRYERLKLDTIERLFAQ